MSSIAPDLPDPMTVVAAQSSRRLAEIVEGKDSPESFAIQIDSSQGEQQPITIPTPALRMLSEILGEMAQGNVVTLTPINAEFTTQEAADFLNVSRPFLIKLLEEGKIPFRRVGTHRRIPSAPVIAFKQQADEASQAALAELAAQAQQHTME